jgi:hypothetical protein
MGKQKDRMEMLRLGNFIADGILDKDGHTTFIEIRTASGNWKMRFDESTWDVRNYENRIRYEPRQKGD